MKGVRAGAFAVCSLLVAGAAFDCAAQTAAAAFSPERLWDGKTPDFRGLWQTRGTLA